MAKELQEKVAAVQLNESIKFTCSLNHCKEELNANGGRVEVRAFPTKSQQDFMVHWTQEADAIFHSKCWSKLVDVAVRDRPLKDLELNKMEREMIKEAWKTAEYHDSSEDLQLKAKRIAEFLLKAKDAIAFTGAGISTAAGIGDFRGKAGRWTELDKSKAHGGKAAATNTKRKKDKRPYNDLRPTYTHEALCKLVELGHIKHIISQNCDGLHRLSGIPPEKLSELHGNTYIEKCEECQARYERPRATVSVKDGPAFKKCKTCRLCHRSGSKCERSGCNGFLIRTIINFGDNLETTVLDGAEEQAKKGDCFLALGSTLMVTPACDLVDMGKQPTRVVICNRQPTGRDELCQNCDKSGDPLGTRVFGDCDKLMKEVMINILSAEELKPWEEARTDRMKIYDSKRVTSYAGNHK